MRTAFLRYMFIVAFLILWIGVIGARLVYLQVTQHEWLLSQAESARKYQHTSKMLRGTIYDRDDRTLAISIRANSLFADPAEIEDAANVAGKLARVLGIDSRKLAADLKEGKESGRRFIWIARKLDDETYKKVNEAFESDEPGAGLPAHRGLGWRKEQKREYPYKTLAAQVLGFSNADDKGQAGIELYQESVLKGEEVKKWRERDRLGRVFDETGTEREPPKDIVLTISRSIQYKTEVALEQAVKASSAKAGRAIVLDPKNGEILAMANYPTFDPNEYGKLSPDLWRNGAVQDSFSPGSVMKMVTYSAALEEGVISPTALVNCGNGKITIGGYTYSDSHAIGPVSYTEAFAQSSNVGAIRTAQSVGREKFYEYVTKYGFGAKTGIELPAETEGILRPLPEWGGMSLASMAIGYEIGVTSLQTAVAFATIANDGVKVQPHILKEIRQSDGKLVSTVKPTTERVVSEKTAKALRKMLREVVTDGTAKKAQLHGYSSAGKTGTAWKYDPQLRRVNRQKYISSFVGFAPADDPRVVIAVTIDEPKGGFRYGGQVAAPVFQQVAEQILPELNVLSDGTLPDVDIPDESNSDDPMLVTADSEDVPGIIASNEPADEPQDKEPVSNQGSGPNTKAVHPSASDEGVLRKKSDERSGGTKDKT